MPILTSPAVAVVEKDYSQVVPFSATGEGAIAGLFKQGPVHKPVLVSTVEELESYFGAPVDNPFYWKTWWSAYNFLQYSGKLWVTRAIASGATNAANAGTGTLIANWDEFQVLESAGTLPTSEFIAKNPGAIGQSIRVIALDSGNWATFINPTNKAYFTEGGSGIHFSEYLKYDSTGPSATDFAKDITTANITKDDVAILVIDVDGKISGQKNKVLEAFSNLSKISDAMDYQGNSIYYRTFVNLNSNYVYAAKILNPTSSGTYNVGTSSFDLNSDGEFDYFSATLVASPYAFEFDEKLDQAGTGVETAITTDEAFSTALETAYSEYLNKDEINVSYLIAADYPHATQAYIINSIAEVRKDCIAFVSPHNNGQPFSSKTTAVGDLSTYRSSTLNVNSSYAVMDSGYKYQFDRYHQKYRWIPLAADVAGLCARNDSDFESWYSPGGFNRGQIKNALKLSSNLNQAARDQLYPKQVNAVVSFPGKGTVLFGDRTLQSKASAFQSIHIRRLFIILEKSIAEAAQYQLFELNNAATRMRFVGMVEPFLRSVQSRDGLADFKVVCDSTNNTDDSIARGEFVADIYIKPLYSIQYVILNFIATKSSVQFNQVIGK